MSARRDLLATPWSRTGVPVRHLPQVDGPLVLALVDLTPRPTPQHAERTRRRRP